MFSWFVGVGFSCSDVRIVPTRLRDVWFLEIYVWPVILFSQLARPNSYVAIEQ
jgi:hypothetical protein